MLELNPLDVLGQRRLESMPPHFVKTKMEDSFMLFDDTVIDWIQSKLKGRYCVTAMPSVNEVGSLSTATFVAFEDQKELTYFMLACPHLRRT